MLNNLIFLVHPECGVSAYFSLVKFNKTILTLIYLFIYIYHVYIYMSIYNLSLTYRINATDPHTTFSSTGNCSDTPYYVSNKICADDALRWYYVSMKQECLRYPDMSCIWTSNRFDSKEECERICIKGILNVQWSLLSIVCMWSIRHKHYVVRNVMY